GKIIYQETSDYIADYENNTYYQKNSGNTYALDSIDSKYPVLLKDKDGRVYIRKYEGDNLVDVSSDGTSKWVYVDDDQELISDIFNSTVASDKYGEQIIPKSAIIHYEDGSYYKWLPGQNPEKDEPTVSLVKLPKENIDAVMETIEQMKDIKSEIGDLPKEYADWETYTPSQISLDDKTRDVFLATLKLKLEKGEKLTAGELNQVARLNSAGEVPEELAFLLEAQPEVLAEEEPPADESESSTTFGSWLLGWIEENVPVIGEPLTDTLVAIHTLLTTPINIDSVSPAPVVAAAGSATEDSATFTLGEFFLDIVEAVPVIGEPLADTISNIHTALMSPIPVETSLEEESLAEQTEEPSFTSEEVKRIKENSEANAIIYEEKNNLDTPRAEGYEPTITDEKFREENDKLSTQDEKALKELNTAAQKFDQYLAVVEEAYSDGYLTSAEEKTIAAAEKKYGGYKDWDTAVKKYNLGAAERQKKRNALFTQYTGFTREEVSNYKIGDKTFDKVVFYKNSKGEVGIIDTHSIAKDRKTETINTYRYEGEQLNENPIKTTKYATEYKHGELVKKELLQTTYYGISGVDDEGLCVKPNGKNSEIWDFQLKDGPKVNQIITSYSDGFEISTAYTYTDPKLNYSDNYLQASEIDEQTKDKISIVLHTYQFSDGKIVIEGVKNIYPLSKMEGGEAIYAVIPKSIIPIDNEGEGKPINLHKPQGKVAISGLKTNHEVRIATITTQEGKEEELEYRVYNNETGERLVSIPIERFEQDAKIVQADIAISKIEDKDEYSYSYNIKAEDVLLQNVQWKPGKIIVTYYERDKASYATEQNSEGGFVMAGEYDEKRMKEQGVQFMDANGELLGTYSFNPIKKEIDFNPFIKTETIGDYKIYTAEIEVQKEGEEKPETITASYVRDKDGNLLENINSNAGKTFFTDAEFSLGDDGKLVILEPTGNKAWLGDKDEMYRWELNVGNVFDIADTENTPWRKRVGGAVMGGLDKFNYLLHNKGGGAISDSMMPPTATITDNENNIQIFLRGDDELPPQVVSCHNPDYIPYTPLHIEVFDKKNDRTYNIVSSDVEVVEQEIRKGIARGDSLEEIMPSLRELAPSPFPGENIGMSENEISSLYSSILNNPSFDSGEKEKWLSFYKSQEPYMRDAYYGVRQKHEQIQDKILKGELISDRRFENALNAETALFIGTLGIGTAINVASKAGYLARIPQLLHLSRPAAQAIKPLQISANPGARIGVSLLDDVPRAALYGDDVIKISSEGIKVAELTSGVVPKVVVTSRLAVLSQSIKQSRPIQAMVKTNQAIDACLSKNILVKTFNKIPGVKSVTKGIISHSPKAKALGEKVTKVGTWAAEKLVIHQGVNALTPIEQIATHTPGLSQAARFSAFALDKSLLWIPTAGAVGGAVLEGTNYTYIPSISVDKEELSRINTYLASQGIEKEITEKEIDQYVKNSFANKEALVPHKLAEDYEKLLSNKKKAAERGEKYVYEKGEDKTERDYYVAELAQQAFLGADLSAPETVWAVATDTSRSVFSGFFLETLPSVLSGWIQLFTFLNCYWVLVSLLVTPLPILTRVPAE
ncbi:MAG: hypothetical protein B5M48_04755, partial [Candidatus Omnitrophica bacterium 4484_213]